MTELSVMLVAGTLVEGATVTIGVDSKISRLTYAVDLSMVPETERTGKKLKPNPGVNGRGGSVVEELEDDMED